MIETASLVDARQKSAYALALRRFYVPAIPLTVLAFFSLATGLHAQTGTLGSATARPLITQAVNSEMTTLSGHVHRVASHEQDLGPVDDSLQLRLYLVLRHSPEQQADLDNLILRQQQPAAAEYHKWLTPQEFGERFGASQQDISKLSSWLQSQGMHLNGVLNNAGFIDFNATSGQVRKAFRTQLHNFTSNGSVYPALTADPMIPAAFASAIAGIHGLNQMPPRSSTVNPHRVSFDSAAHRWQNAESSPTDFFSPAASVGGSPYNVSPQDLYTIYNVNKVLNPAPLGMNDMGAGSSIAVIEASDFAYGTVDPVTGLATGGDVATFRSLFGVGGGLNLHVYHGYGTQSCSDPGTTTTGNLDLEAALDAEWANALAPAANLFVISCANLNTALLAAVDYNLADILSLSFNYGSDQSSSVFFDSLWSQAVAQGQSVFVSTGDSGSDDEDQNTTSTATSGLNVNAAASSPLVTAVGGTDFSDVYDSQKGGVPESTYWSAANSAYYESALGYIPETAWNQSCASSIFAAYNGYRGADYCATGQSLEGYYFLGGSGGFSSHYAVPAYQMGTLGYSGTLRALPDISGFASVQFFGHALLFCDSDFSYWACTSSSNVGGGGGTSFVAPYIAGIAALLNSHTGSRQGLLNPGLYALAKAQFSSSSTASACYSNGQTSNTGITVGLPASQCIFNDVTTGNNDVACAAGSLSCYVNPGAYYGMLSLTGAASLTVAYPSTPGYDEATGIGTLNAYNLITNWTKAFSSSVSLTATPTSILSTGSTLLTATVTTGLPAGYVDSAPPLIGSVAFSAATGSLGGCSLSGGACSITVSGSALQSGANSISATFQGSGTYPAATSSIQTVTVAGGNTQTITFTPLPAVSLGVAPFALAATASSGLQVSYASTTTAVCSVSASTVAVLAAGTCTITASQAGNTAFAAATPVTQSFQVIAAPQVGYLAYWGVNNTGVTISWSTDLLATTQIAYGTTKALGQLSPLQTGLSNSHGVVLTTLSPGTTYYFVAQSTAASGATGYSATYSFTTTGTPTIPAPVISNVAATGINSTSATITWTTDQASSSQVNYGPTASYGSSSPLNTALVTTHTVTLNGLMAAVTYNFDVVSANASSVSSTSVNFTFATTGTVLLPIISNVATSGVTSSSVTIAWTTDQATSSLVNYGTTTAYGSASTLNTALVTSHFVTLTGLTAATTYDFDVVSANSANSSATSANSTFTTSTSAGTPPDLGYLAYWGITNASVTISWSTDTLATTQLAYGTTTALGQLTPLQSALTASHGVVLSGLNPGTTYYFVAQSTAANGATGYSISYSFTTTGTPTAPGPVLSSVTSTNITSTSTTITWTTDQPSSSQVNYGTATSYGSFSALDTTLVTSHSVTLNGLTAATTYNFDVVSANSSSVASTSSNFTFSTIGAGIPPPVISNVATSGITADSVTITWTTDQASSSLVNYGTTTSYSFASTFNTSLVTSHSVTLTGLAAGTTYDFDVVSANSTNTSATSANSSFITSTSSGTPPYVGYVAYWGVNNTGVTISWSTDVLATTQLAYGNTTALGQLTTLQTTLTASHGLALTGLNPGTTYYFVAQSTAANGATGYSTTYSFTTTGTATTPAPVVSSVIATGITSTSATITWITDQASSSQVNYGTTTSYGSSSTPNTTLVTTHAVTLTGLTAGTTYNFDVVSANSTNISSAPANSTFTTTATPTGPPPVLGYVNFYGVSNSAVTISWSTDVLSTTQVAYGTTTALGQLSPLQTALAQSHGVILTGLNPGTTYYFVAQSTNASSATGYSTRYSFITTGSSVPTISGVSVTPATGNTATITWTTSVPTNNYVQYGPAAGSYNRYSAQTTLTATPQCTLPFVPSGIVHYQLVSTDAYGTQTVSRTPHSLSPR